MLNTVVLLEEDHARIRRVLDRLLADASARLVFVVSRNGESIASAGDSSGVDSTSLGSLAAGTVAATRGLARLVGEDEFAVLFHEGVREHLQVNLVPGGGILLIWFDHRTSLGLVRLRAKRATADLAEAFAAITERAMGVSPSVIPAGPLRGLSDDDIDALFR